MIQINLIYPNGVQYTAETLSVQDLIQALQSVPNPTTTADTISLYVNGASKPAVPRANPITINTCASALIMASAINVIYGHSATGTQIS